MKVWDLYESVRSDGGICACHEANGSLQLVS